MKKAAIKEKYCVGCGVCVKTCPKSAIEISRGVFAEIDKEQCVGCGKCAKVCPAFLIYMEEL